MKGKLILPDELDYLSLSSGLVFIMKKQQKVMEKR